MNALLLPLLLAVAPAPVADAAPAAEAAPVAEVAPAPAPAPAPLAGETVAVDAPETPPGAEERCLRETGSRIHTDRRHCDAMAGDVYDRDDIERSGATDTADAIRKLSAGATVRR